MPEITDAQLEILTILKTSYSGYPKNPDENAMIALSSLINHSIGVDNIDKILNETVTVIHRLFDFQFVTIALKGNDGLFRYTVQLGLTAEGEKKLFQIAYTDEDLFNDSIFPSTSVSNITRFYMSENMPYKEDEASTFGRPQLLSQKRTSPDEMIEGDYIDVFMYNRNKEIIGYVELSLTRSRIMPDRSTIRWLELIATIVAILISKGH